MTAFSRKVFSRIFFFFILLITIFLELGIINYSPKDPSFVSQTFPLQTSRNITGSLGTQFAGVVIYLFGLVSYVIPLGGLFVMLKFLKFSNHLFVLFFDMWIWLLFVLCASVFLTIYPIDYAEESFFMSSGGVFGLLFVSVFQEYIGVFGLKLLAIGGMLLSVYLLLGAGVVFHFFQRFLGPFVAWMNPVRWFTSRSQQLKKQIKEESECVVAQPILDSSKEVKFEGNIDKKAREHELSKVFKQLPATGEAKQNMQEEASLHVSLLKVLNEFGVSGRITGAKTGPVVTVYEFELSAGIKSNIVIQLANDIALALKVESVFVFPIRQKRALGIQVPNLVRKIVPFSDVLVSEEYQHSSAPLTVAIGKLVDGRSICVDLATMPHLLMAGSTGAGKSIAIHSLICSILTKSLPYDVRMILVDPKILELSFYDGIPHLLMPVVTEAGKASLALKWAIKEMEHRYHLMSSVQARSVEVYNQSILKHKEAKTSTLEHLPYIVIVIDELADLMLSPFKDIEQSIQRLTQKARAAGIHLVLATQRPSVDVITGVIKANLPVRIAFQVTSIYDSRTIIDQVGAEKLLGKGDMLFIRPGVRIYERIQGAYICEKDILRFVEKLKYDNKTNYDKELLDWIN